MAENVREDRLVYDFGMNIAEDTEYYLERGFRVVAVEADPVMCAKAEERFRAQVANGSLVVVNKAIGRERGKFRFHICDTLSAWSTASDEMRDLWTAQGATFHTIDVDFVDASELIAEFGEPYYVKIDIEGHDQICLDQMYDAAVRPTWVSLELDVKRSRRALATLQKMGYDRFTLVDQSKVPGQRIPPTSTEGRYVDYSFRTGQTGKFGSDLDQPSFGLDQISLKLRKMRWQGKAAKLITLLGRIVPGVPDAARLFPSTQTWYDLHARMS
jgi:FkbM family methyltransferase